MWIVITFVFAFSSFLTFFVSWIKSAAKVKQKNYVDGPKGLPFIGIGLEFIGSNPVEIFEKINKLATEWNGLLRTKLGNQKVLLAATPEDIEAIMTDQRFLKKSEHYDMLRPWLQDGLLTVSEKLKWQSRRKALTPAFHFKILDEFVQVFEQQADILIDVLQRHATTGEAFDISQYINLYTLDVICETSMGVKINALTDIESEYVHAVKEITSIIFWRMHHFLARSDFYWRFTHQKRRHDFLVKKIHDFTISVIENRKQNRINVDQDECENIDEFGIKRRPALLDILLEAKVDGMPLSTKDIHEEVDNFMFAGHDTTTATIEFLLFNLAKYPDVQQKVYDEIVEVFGDNLDVTLCRLNHLRYLDLVMKESLRLFPSVPLIGRYIEEDIVVNGRVYPANHNVLMGIFMMQRDPKIFPDPLTFGPERFLDQKSHETVNAFSYTPFSGGYRNCIGQKFAQFEIKTLISKLLLNYKIEIMSKDFKPELAAEIILRPANGIWIKLNNRRPVK